jgi:hypothetical protein
MPTLVADKRVLDREYPGWTHDPKFAYIGRRSKGMHFGNPFSHHPRSLAAVRVRTVARAVAAFEAWLDGREHQEIEPDRRQWILNNLEQLRNKTLVCFGCQPCHGHVYVQVLGG